MLKSYTLKSNHRNKLWLLLPLLFLLPMLTHAQVGVGGAEYSNLNQAFAAINAGTHTGNIIIEISGNTSEPLTPTPLNASGQGSASYTSILIRPVIQATVSGATGSTGRGIIELNGADYVTIDGSIGGGTTRDLTFQNTSTQAASTVIRLIGASGTFFGATNNTIKNCKIIGASNTNATAFGIHAGSSSATSAISGSSSGYNFDNLTIENNEISNAGVGIYVRALLASASAEKLVILNNDIFDILQTGIDLTRTTGGSDAALISRNRIYNFKSTTAATTTPIQGMLIGADVVEAEISRNEIYGLHNNASTGRGAIGIHANASNSNNLFIHNNLIYDLNKVSGNSTANQVLDGAYGIRFDGSNSGHRIYYNSIHLFGSPLGSATASINSAALHVNSASNTGLDIQNNIFSNQMTKGTAGSAVFAAVSFSASYNYSTLTMNNNGYFVGTTTDHHVGRQTTNANYYTTVADWKTVTGASTVSPSNDDSSVPLTNGPAPFISNTNLSIPANTVTPLESGGVAISAATIDFTGNSRPRTYVPQVSGANTKPDIGAYEFNGGVGDFTAPEITNVSTATAACNEQAHNINATITDASGIASAAIVWTVNGTPQTNIAMVKQGATDVWSGTIPAQGSNLVEYFITATDNSTSANSSTSNSQLYRDQYLSINAGPDKQSTIGSGAVLTAESYNFGGHIKISEVMQYKTSTIAEATYASFIPTTDNEFVEISNTGNLTVDVSGYILQMVGTINTTFVVPNGVILEPGQVLTLAVVGSANDPANRFFGMSAAPSTLTSSVPWGYVLKNNSGKVIDVLGTNSVAFSAFEAVGVTSADWSTSSSTFLTVASSRAGVQRKKDTSGYLEDTNTEEDWVVTTASGPQLTIGIYNDFEASETTSITWTNGANGNLAAPATGKSVTTPNYNSAGTYTYIATVNDGNCTYQDAVVITVVAPVIPVADFEADTTTIRTAETVTFTDLSANLPGTWAWSFSGPGTVSYVNGTSASSQHPQVQFSAAGSYSVTLVASNAAGSDTKTITDYITVYWNYCTAVQSACGASSNRYIESVEFNTITNLNSGCSNVNPSNSYSIYYPWNHTTNVMVDNTYDLKVTTSNTSTSTSYLAVWIDFNNNGTFETNEYFFYGTTTIQTIPANTTVTIPIKIPSNAVSGTVGMRIRLHGNTTGFNSSAACTAFTSLAGETEDYFITIEPRPAADAGLVMLISPNHNKCTSANEPVVVRLKNFGTAPVSNVPVTVNVTGAATATLNATYTGTLAAGDSVNFTVGTLNTTAGGVFVFNGSTSLAGDGDASNDAMPAASRNINATPAAPAVSGTTFCTGSTATLTANGTGTLRWYNQATGGNPVATGNSFTTPALSATTTYYVEDAGNPFDNVGLKETTTATTSYTSSTAGYGINFTVNETIILRGVYVYVRTGGSNVIVQLRSGHTGTTSAAPILQTAPTVAVATAGVKTYIPLNFVITPGDYRLTSGNTTTLSNDFSSNNAAVVYPFTSSNGEVSIVSSRTGSNTTLGYYNFYDWDIVTEGCPSSRTAVTATLASAGTWTGAASTDWHNNANWSCNTLPTSSTEVTIPAGLTNYPVIASGTALANNITVSSGASLTFTNGTLQLFGNFSNSGTFTHSAGTLELKGSGAQQLDGVTLTNLTVNGTGSKTLGSNVTVNGAVVMTEGTLSTNGHKLILGSSATISETEGSFVSGTVETTRDISSTANVTFGGLGLELQPAFASTLPGMTTVRRVTGAPMNLGSKNSIARYFDIAPAVNSNLNVTMVFRYLSAEVGSSHLEETFMLFRSADQGGTWAQQNGSVVDTTANTVTLTGIGAFSYWSVGDGTLPLPVELVSFQAVKQGNDVVATWSTASEKDSKGFDVQVSDNGSDFRSLGFVKSYSSNSNRLQTYSFTDREDGKAGIRYYRLKQQDLDGSVSFSVIRAVRFEELKQQAEVYPNPFASNLTLTIQASQAETATVRITDLTGKTILVKEVKVEKGANQVMLELPTAPAGMYLMTTQIGNERFTSKLVKQ